MQFKAVLILAALAAAAQAAAVASDTESGGFTIPEGTKNGVYIYDSATKEHTPYVPPKEARDAADAELIDIARRAEELEARKHKTTTTLPRAKISCSDGVVDSLDYQQLTYSFHQSCYGQHLGPSQNLYAYYDGFAAFICNTGGHHKPQPCSYHEFLGCLTDINRQCKAPSGQTITGEEWSGHWKKGYGIAAPGAKLCHHQ